MALNIITAKFCSGSNQTWTDEAWQYDYGQVLRLEGLELPDAYEVHFSNAPINGNAKPQIGNADGVEIPDEYFESGEPIYAWLFLHQGEDDGETEKMVTIPIKKRSKEVNEQPTPVEQSAITQAIAALNIAVEKAEDAIEHYPQIIDGTWHVWDVTEEEYVDTDVQAQGEQGQPGTDGTDGQDGFSPVITVTDITGGHRVTITDATGTQTFDVMNGQDGQPGTPGTDGTDGYSPTVTVTEITGGHRVTITDAQGAHTFDVMDGSGTSITVDSALSTTSENPVQNKVINGALSAINEDITELQTGKADIIITSASGTVASFTDGAEYDAVGLTAEFAPYQEGSGDPSPTNVRPIHGWTGLNIQRTGKNFLDKTSIKHGYYDTDGNYTSSSSYISYDIDLPKGVYTFSTDLPNNYFTRYLINNVTNEVAQAVQSITFTLSSNSNLKISMRKTNSADISEETPNVMIEIGSVATSYEPYQSPETTPISWQTEAGEVLGGYVDVVRGKLVVTWAIAVMNGNSSFIGNDSYDKSIGTDRALILQNAFIGDNYNALSPDNAKCDKLIQVKRGIWGDGDTNTYIWNYTINAKTQFHVLFDNATVGIETSDDFSTRTQKIKAWLANNPITLAYRCRNEVEYDLTPETIELLKGYNNVWTNAGGNVDVQYRADTKLYLETHAPKVDDVQVNGASVVTDGVANVPIAGNGVLGAVSVYGDGIAINSVGRLRVSPATSARIKEGTMPYVPADVAHQHESTFYGLAKAAGSDEKNSSLAVGQYTDAAKVAIQKMLGIYEAPWELLNDVTTSEDLELVTITTDLNGEPFKLKNGVIVINAPQTLTGNRDHLTFRSYGRDVNENYILNTFPTLMWQSPTFGCIFYYEFNLNGVTPQHNYGFSVNGYGLSQTSSSRMLIETPVKYLERFDVKQYAESQTLVPSGTRIRIYGQRYVQ